MKHLIMGTAGHIDHGKTALIKALTGIDCDTHKEEKKRGMTINLGFAHLELPGGGSIGIIDVPGHRDFVHTMVGGASGIDFVLLTVAADSGVMPQTREHLQIMKVLNLRSGIIAMTKTDLIDNEELLGLTRADIRELVKGTFLETAPIVDVSSKTGQGIDELKRIIGETASGCIERPSGGFFRMFVDRIFSVSGFGTVVAGSVSNGKLRTKDDLFLLPGRGKKLTARRMERHGKEVEEVFAGDRASINLSGLSREDFRRGMCLSNEALNGTALLDAELELFGNSGDLGIWTRVIFHAGTYEKQARVHLIDKNTLTAGQDGLVQIHLKEPCVLIHGDRFVIRSSSGDRTLGGGKVIDIHPLLHRRRPEKLIKKMAAISTGKPGQLIASEVMKSHRALRAEDIAFKLNIPVEEVEKCVSSGLPEGIVKYDNGRGMVFITWDLKEEIRQEALSAVREFRKQNPYIERGATLAEIRGTLKIESGSPGEEVLKMILEQQKRKGNLLEKEKTWLPPEGLRTDNGSAGTHLKFFSGYIKSFGMQVPLPGQLRAEAEKRNLTEKQLKQVLHNLTSSGEIYRIQDDYVHSDIVNECRTKLVAELKKREEGITVSGFRDLVGGNRKICLLLLARYDSEMLTRRIGDLRILIKKEE